jgi:hypothetical protein
MKNLPNLNLLFCIGFFLFSSICKSQIKEEVIQLSEKHYLLDVYLAGKNGFVLKTGKTTLNSKKLDFNLLYYSNNLEKKWSIPIDKLQINKGLSEELIVSKTGKTVYHLEYMGYNQMVGSSKISTTVISNDGTKSNFEIEGIKDFGYRQITIGTDDCLVFLCTKDGNEVTINKKNDEKLVLHKINNVDFKITSIELSLPKFENPKQSTFWKYIGHTDKKIILESKTIPDYKQINILECKIVEIDFDGNILNISVLKPDLGKYYIGPSVCIDDFNGTNKKRRNHDINTMMSNDDPTDVFKIGAYGNTVVDSIGYFVYGTFLEKPNKNFGAMADNAGFFIVSFDENGNKNWDTFIKYSTSIKFDQDGSFYKVTLLSGNQLLFQRAIKRSKTVYSFIINNKNGEILAKGNSLLETNEISDRTPKPHKH